MVTSSFLPGRGGIESYLAELCARLSPRLAVLAAGRRDGRPLPVDLPYPADGYTGSLLIPSARVLLAVQMTAAKYGTDKVLFGTPWPLALLGPALKRRGLRYAVIVHGAELLVPGAVPGLSRRVARCLAAADLLLPVSGYTSDRLRALIERHGLAVPRLERLHARVDLTRFRPDVDTQGVRESLGLATGERVILCFGRLVKRKGVDRLVATLAVVNERVPEAVVVVAGTGPELGALKRQAGDVPGRVVFTGPVPDEEAAPLYALADVFALPVADRYRGLEIEGLGVVLLEASACGTPCVAGRSGGTPEAVVDGVTGFVVDATHSDELVDRICWLLEHPSEAQSMGAAGRAHVAAEFSDQQPPEPLLAWLSDQLP